MRPAVARRRSRRHRRVAAVPRRRPSHAFGARSSMTHDSVRELLVTFLFAEYVDEFAGAGHDVVADGGLDGAPRPFDDHIDQFAVHTPASFHIVEGGLIGGQRQVDGGGDDGPHATQHRIARLHPDGLVQLDMRFVLPFRIAGGRRGVETLPRAHQCGLYGRIGILRNRLCGNGFQRHPDHRDVLDGGGVDARHRDALVDLLDQRALVDQLVERLPQRRPTDSELPGHLDFTDPVARLESTLENGTAQLRENSIASGHAHHGRYTALHAAPPPRSPLIVWQLILQRSACWSTNLAHLHRRAPASSSARSTVEPPNYAHLVMRRGVLSVADHPAPRPGNSSWNPPYLPRNTGVIVPSLRRRCFA